MRFKTFQKLAKQVLNCWSIFGISLLIHKEIQSRSLKTDHDSQI